MDGTIFDVVVFGLHDSQALSSDTLGDIRKGQTTGEIHISPKCNRLIVTYRFLPATSGYFYDPYNRRFDFHPATSIHAGIVHRVHLTNKLGYITSDF